LLPSNLLTTIRKITGDMTQIIKATTKQTLRQTSMRFHSERTVVRQPLPGKKRSTEGDRQQRQQFFQALFLGNMSRLQTKSATL
jgi:hypothetical protein